MAGRASGQFWTGSPTLQVRLERWLAARSPARDETPGGPITGGLSVSMPSGSFAVRALLDVQTAHGLVDGLQGSARGPGRRDDRRPGQLRPQLPLYRHIQRPPATAVRAHPTRTDPLRWSHHIRPATPPPVTALAAWAYRARTRSRTSASSSDAVTAITLLRPVKVTRWLWSPACYEGGQPMSALRLSRAFVRAR